MAQGKCAMSCWAECNLSIAAYLFLYSYSNQHVTPGRLVTLCLLDAFGVDLAMHHNCAHLNLLLILHQSC